MMTTLRNWKYIRHRHDNIKKKLICSMAAANAWILTPFKSSHLPNSTILAKLYDMLSFTWSNIFDMKWQFFFMTRLETECWSSHAWCAWCHMRSTKFQLIESHSYKYITITTIWIGCCISRAQSQISKFMGPTWGPPGSFRPQMGPMLAPWTLLSGMVTKRKDKTSCRKTRNRQIGC